MSRRIIPSYETRTERTSKASTPISIDITRVRNSLDILHESKDLPVRKLSDEAQTAYEYIVRAVTVLYETEAYEDLYQNEFLRVFADRVETQIPGSVAAYVVGCAKTAGCSVTCAGSAPAPGSASSICRTRVLIGTYEDGGYTFQTLGMAPSSHAVIYVEKGNPPALSASEKRILTESGITSVEFVVGNPKGTTETVASGDVATFVARPDVVRLANPPSAVSISLSVVVIVLLAVGALLLVYKVAKSSREEE